MSTDIRNMNQEDYMKTQVHPMLNEALEQLIKHIIETDEIIQHQERLKEQKILDKLEQKRIDKERLKEELGSQYESSDDEDDFNEPVLDIQQKELSQQAEQEEKEEEKEEEKKSQNGDDQEIDNKKLEINDQQLEDIKEDPAQEEMLEDDDHPLQPEKKKNAFNPILFLADALQSVYDKNKLNK